MESNARAGIKVLQPKTTVERTRVAGLCASALEMTMPLLVDSIENEAGEAYAAFPDRLYLVGRDGRVAYKGGRGPFGYHPRELEQAMVLLLAEEGLRGF
jgi:hypothetical protein